VLPGIRDLRRNVTKTGSTIVFSTGGAIPGPRSAAPRCCGLSSGCSRRP